MPVGGKTELSDAAVEWSAEDVAARVAVAVERLAELRTPRLPERESAADLIYALSAVLSNSCALSRALRAWYAHEPEAFFDRDQLPIRQPAERLAAIAEGLRGAEAALDAACEGLRQAGASVTCLPEGRLPRAGAEPSLPPSGASCDDLLMEIADELGAVRGFVSGLTSSVDATRTIGLLGDVSDDATTLCDALRRWPKMSSCGAHRRRSLGPDPRREQLSDLSEALDSVDHALRLGSRGLRAALRHAGALERRQLLDFA